MARRSGVLRLRGAALLASLVALVMLVLAGPAAAGAGTAPAGSAPVSAAPATVAVGPVSTVVPAAHLADAGPAQDARVPVAPVQHDTPVAGAPGADRESADEAVRVLVPRAARDHADEQPLLPWLPVRADAPWYVTAAGGPAAASGGEPARGPLAFSGPPADRAPPSSAGS